jgi:REP element-mobilizing transposase RayT
MPQYLRAFIPGGTFFFTVALLERHRKLLTEHLDNLRASFMAARQRRPFTVEAMVILPDHLHCIWTRPFTVTYDAVFLTLNGRRMITFGVWRWNDAKGGMRFAFPPYGP